MAPNHDPEATHASAAAPTDFVVRRTPARPHASQSVSTVSPAPLPIVQVDAMRPLPSATQLVSTLATRSVPTADNIIAAGALVSQVTQQAVQWSGIPTPTLPLTTGTDKATSGSPSSPFSGVTDKPKTSLLTKLMCGAIAGITGTCIIYPLDMVKTRLQNQSRNTGASQAAYRNGWHCFQTIVRQEGVAGLYRGLPANLVGITPEKAIKLAVNDAMRDYLASRQYRLAQRSSTPSMGTGPDPDALSIPMGMLSGSVAGFCQVIATNPMEIVKINTQMAGQLALKAGTPAKTSWEIVRELGLRGLYRGTPATLLRDVPFSFIFFPASAYLKQVAADRDRARGGNGKVSFGMVFLSGIGAGVMAAAAVTPADVIKTRLQTQSTGIQYRGIGHAALEIYSKEGLVAFFKGAPQRVMIIAPLFGITLLVYEAQQRWFSGSKQ